jgi:hypothetical protein
MISATEEIREPKAEGRYAGSNDRCERGKSSYGRKWACRMENFWKSKLLFSAQQIHTEYFEQISFYELAMHYRYFLILANIRS